MVESGQTLDRAFFLGLLAELESEAIGVQSALSRVDEALAFTTQSESRFCLAFLHRLRGDLLLKRDPANPAPAEEAFQTAIAVARDQGARSFELRAALAIAKLYQSTGRPAEAHAVLAPALEGFSSTQEMPEIAEAQALLAELVKTDEVMTAIGERQRRLDLQTSFARAVLWSKGWAADDTKAAFERAGDLATSANFPSKRFLAPVGQFLWSLNCGEVRAARDIAGRFLREAEADGRTAEIGAARDLLGIACIHQGDLAEVEANSKAR